MGNFSKPPLDVLKGNLDQGYVGLHVEQGVPVLDRDLNLLGDLIAAQLRAVISRYIGDGIADGGPGFSVLPLIPPTNDFLISAGGVGTLLAGGMEVSIQAAVQYSTQKGVPALTPAGASQRIDTVYLDASTTEVSIDPAVELDNPDDVAMRTSVRRKAVWVVRVAEGVNVAADPPGVLPVAPFGHTYVPLALLARPAGTSAVDAGVIKDLRQTNLSMTALERRVRAIEGLMAPVITGFPTHTLPNQKAYLISGRNFQMGKPRVFFGNAEATVDAETSTDTELYVTVPLGARPGSQPLRVRNGVAETVAGNVTIVPLDPPLLATAGQQINVKQQRVGFPITVAGGRFTLVNQVQFNSTPPVAVPLTPPNADPTRISVTVPPSIAVGSTVTLTLSIEGAFLGDGTAPRVTTADTLLVQPATAPFFAAPGGQITPTHARTGTGATITLKGGNFGSNALKPVVRFHTATPVTAPAADITVPAADTIQVKLPAAVPAGSVIRISVTLSGWSATTDDQLTVVA